MTENTREDRDHLQPEELGWLHAALIALAPFGPAPGFTDRVLRRVRLPVPWRLRAVATVRAHWVAAGVACAGLLGAVGLGAAWAARYPDLNPVAVGAFIAQRAAVLLWGAVMEAGRLVYASGIVAAAQGAVEQLTLTTAFLAVATVTLVGLGALRIMLNLMHAAPAARPATRV